MQRRVVRNKGYSVSVLEGIQQPDRQNILFSTGLCQPAEKYLGLSELSSLSNVVIAEICGHRLGGHMAARSLEEQAYFNSLVAKEYGWNDYLLIGHSMGGGAGLHTLCEEPSPRAVVALEPPLTNTYTPEKIIRKVRLHGIMQTATQLLRRPSTLKLAKRARDNWRFMVSNGHTQTLLEDIAGATWEQMYGSIPSAKSHAMQIYLSKKDYLFPADDATREEIRDAHPQADVTLLENGIYTHGWPATFSEEVKRLVLEKEDPLEPDNKALVAALTFAGIAGALLYANARRTSDI